ISMGGKGSFALPGPKSSPRAQARRLWKSKLVLRKGLSTSVTRFEALFKHDIRRILTLWRLEPLSSRMGFGRFPRKGRTCEQGVRDEQRNSHAHESGGGSGGKAARLGAEAHAPASGAGTASVQGKRPTRDRGSLARGSGGGRRSGVARHRLQHAAP